MKHKKRSIAAARAAALKGWRTRKRMKEVRGSGSPSEGFGRFTGSLVLTREMAGEEYLTNYEAALRRSLHQTTGRTIDLIPKVEWER